MADLLPQYNQDLHDRTMTFGKSFLNAMSPWYHDGHWHQSVDENGRWGRFLSLPQLAATMWRYDNSLTDYRDVAVESVENTFKWNLWPLYKAAAPYSPHPPLAANGYLSHVVGQTSKNRYYSYLASGEWGTYPPENESDPSFETGEDLIALVWTLDMLYYGPDGKTPSGGIDTTTAKRWLRNLKACMDWLYDINGHPTYYSNGNIVACIMAAAGHLADFVLRFEGPGAEWNRYREIYEQTYFTLFTPSLNYPATTYGAQFAGYGIVKDTTGVYYDWSDTFAHFTEVSNHIVPIPTPNNDWVYGNAQMTHVAMLFSVTRDERLNHILNGLYNTLEARMNWSTFTMDCSGGSRQNGSATRGGMTGPFFVMSLMSGRYPPLRVTRLANTATMLAAWDTASTGYAATFNPVTVNIPHGWASGAVITVCGEVAYIMHAANQANQKLF